jgi:hypothetical protein
MDVQITTTQIKWYKGDNGMGLSLATRFKPPTRARSKTVHDKRLSLAVFKNRYPTVIVKSISRKLVVLEIQGKSIEIFTKQMTFRITPGILEPNEGIVVSFRSENLTK